MSKMAKQSRPSDVHEDRASKPDPVLVKTNHQRFEWEGTILQRTGRLKGKAVAVGFYLSKCWNVRSAIAFPQIEQIAEYLGLGLTAVKSALAELREADLILVKKGRKRHAEHEHNVYYLVLQPAFKFEANSLKYQDSNGRSYDCGHSRGYGCEADAREEGQENGAIAGISEPSTVVGATMNAVVGATTNQITELQGEPKGSPLDSGINTDPVTRAKKLDNRDALEARPVEASVLDMSPTQLNFFNHLAEHQQLHFLNLSPDDRDNYQNAYESMEDDDA